MHEPIEILEKQLITLRNEIKGTNERINKANDAAKRETELLDLLKYKELEFKKTVDKLRS